jgi:hypothetical protein
MFCIIIGVVTLCLSIFELCLEDSLIFYISLGNGLEWDIWA